MIVRVYLCPKCQKAWANGQLVMAEVERSLYANVGSSDCRVCGGPIDGSERIEQMELL